MAYAKHLVDLHELSGTRGARRIALRLLGGVVAMAAALGAGAASAQGFSVTSLVTDDQGYLTSQGYGSAVTVDPNLVNPWGMDQAPGGPWFIGDTGSEHTGAGYSYGSFYTGAGVSRGQVTIPEGATPPNGPTGVVYNTSATGFVLSDGSHAQFLIDSLDGSIAGLAAGATQALIAANGVVPAPGMGPPHSIYTGLATGSVGSNAYIYAANNGLGRVDVYDSSYQPVTLAGAFSDPTAAAAGLVPYNVQNLNGKIWVTYSIPGPGSAQAGLGSGAVAEFNADGTLVRHFTQGGALSSPWAINFAPSSFGDYAGDLLVGNFSHDDNGQTDAFINIFDPTSGAYLGVLKDAAGKTILLPGLWDIDVGDDGVAGSSQDLYFTAGIGDEQHGLFGYISSTSAAPEPSAWVLMIAGVGLVGAALRRASSRASPPAAA